MADLKCKVCDTGLSYKGRGPWPKYCDSCREPAYRKNRADWKKQHPEACREMAARYYRRRAG